jgi:hypothetical protein
MQKYGRSFHLPISPGATSDDKIMAGIDGLMVDDLVITEKMDGENTTLHAGGTYARSPDSKGHPSRTWAKAFAAGIAPQLGAEERIVGENLYARHSVGYDALPSFFLGFAWILGSEVQPWDRTLARFAALGILPVPQLYRGPYRPGLFEDIAGKLDFARQEGFVVRVAAGFDESRMPRLLGKYVRKDHVQGDRHWMQAKVVPNRLAGT